MGKHDDGKDGKGEDGLIGSAWKPPADEPSDDTVTPAGSGDHRADGDQE